MRIERNLLGWQMENEQPDFDGVPVDRTTVAQTLLNIDNKRRGNPLPWNGQFSPELVEALLRAYAPRNGLVLDPFSGSGTVLCEAGSLGLPATGTEINPAAFKMSQIYCLINVTVAERKRMTDEVDRALYHNLTHEALPLFTESGNDGPNDMKASLVEIYGQFDGLATQSLFEALIVLLDFYKGVSEEKVFATWARLKSLVLRLPESGEPIRLLNCDARTLPLESGAADFVVTSPPYINVFNYHQQYRRSAEALGWNLLKVAPAEIGSNRKHRQNRFLTVIQYCLDMADVLGEIKRVCKHGARAIIVVGRESNVRKTRFFNGEIVASLATRCAGFSFVTRQERGFVNRFGEQIFEELLHFDVSANAKNCDEAPQVARAALEKARRRVPEESRRDLEEALAQLDHVDHSPIFNSTAARHPCKRTIKESAPA